MLGRLLGIGFGYMFWGFLGALLGFFLGYHLDRAIKRRHNAPVTEQAQRVFFTTTFSVMGHLAKADGRVSDDEIRVARRVMAQMQLGEQQTREAITLFNEGKQEEFPLDEVISDFKIECGRSRNLLQMFLEIQISTVFADGAIDDAERQLLIRIGKLLGFQRYFIEHLIKMVDAQRRFAGQSGQVSQTSLEDAYAMLDVSKDASDAEIKKMYRKLMSQHHPDKLVSKGLPEEMVKLATEKTQEIKAAYEQIKKARAN